MLHDAADVHILPVGERVHVQLETVFQELVNQDGKRLQEFGRFGRIGLHRGAVVGDHHRAPAQDVGRANDNRVANLLGGGHGLFHTHGSGVAWLRNPQLTQQVAEALPVFGQVNGLGRGADDVHPGALERRRQVQRRLPAELHNRADGPLAGDDVHHILKRQRLEVEPVGGVVVGGDRLRVAVHHQRLVPCLLERESGVAAAVVEFDSLPDAVGPAAQDQNLAAIGGLALVLLFVGGVEVGRVGLELSRAGVHSFENSFQALLQAARAHLVRRGLPESGQMLVGKAGALGFAQQLARHVSQLMSTQLFLQGYDFLQLTQKPGINPGQPMDFLSAFSLAQRCEQNVQSLRRGCGQQFMDLIFRQAREGEALAGFERAHAFEQRFLEGAPDGHHLAHRAHLRAQPLVGAGKFLKLPLGNLGHHVVNRRLETGRGFLRDVVGNFVQAQPHRQLGRDLGDGKAGGF